MPFKTEKIVVFLFSNIRKKNLNRWLLPNKENFVGAADWRKMFTLQFLLAVYPALLMTSVVCLKKLWRNAPALAKQCLDSCCCCIQWHVQEMSEQAANNATFCAWTHSGWWFTQRVVFWTGRAVHAALFWATNSLRNFFSTTLSRVNRRAAEKMKLFGRWTISNLSRLKTRFVWTEFCVQITQTFCQGDHQSNYAFLN